MPEHRCRACKALHPDRYLYNLKGCAPGGEKVMCPECAMNVLVAARVVAVAEMKERAAQVAHKHTQGIGKKTDEDGVVVSMAETRAVAAQIEQEIRALE